MSCVVVFGRPPIEGTVKTRLAADVGSEAAVRIYRVLLEETLHSALQTGVRVVLSLAEETDYSWRPPHGVEVEGQVGGDLGERMASAFRSRFDEGCEETVLVGSDCPQLRPRHLLEAFEALGRVPAVIGPARDGGYWLVGQRRPGADLFRSLSWSSSRTCEQTRTRLVELGIRWHELECLEDVDTAADLEALLASNVLRADLLDRLRGALERWRKTPR